MSIVIGLTGPTGSGKSSTAKVCRKYGIKTVDCDQTARKATEKGSDGLLAITKVFGQDILEEDRKDSISHAQKTVCGTGRKGELRISIPQAKDERLSEF